MTPAERQQRHRARRREEREANADRPAAYRLEVLLRRTLVAMRRADAGLDCARAIRAIEDLLGERPKPQRRPLDDIAPPEQIIAEGTARRRRDHKFWRVRHRPEDGGSYFIEFLGKDRKGRREWQVATYSPDKEWAVDWLRGVALPLSEGMSLPAGIKSAPRDAPS
jgi:hypothetical protein